MIILSLGAWALLEVISVRVINWISLHTIRSNAIKWISVVIRDHFNREQTLALMTWILSIFLMFSLDLSAIYFAHFSGCWASFLYSCHSTLECYNMFLESDWVQDHFVLLFWHAHLLDINFCNQLIFLLCILKDGPSHFTVLQNPDCRKTHWVPVSCISHLIKVKGDPLSYREWHKMGLTDWIQCREQPIWNKIKLEITEM